MPLKLNIALSRKVGEPNYGSRGATVGLEMEVEASLIHEPQRLQERISHLFCLAKQSVDQELTGQSGRNGEEESPNGAVGGHDPVVPPATCRQVSAIHAIANDRQIDLIGELQNRFGVDRPKDLSIRQASELIDALKQLSPDAPVAATGPSPAETNCGDSEPS